MNRRPRLAPRLVAALPGTLLVVAIACEPPEAPWSPAPGTTWFWQLQGEVSPPAGVAMVDIDLFDTAASTIADLQAAGHVVICYFSAGSWEDWRPDAGDFDAADLGNPLDGWPGERWLDVRSASVRSRMEARIQLAADRGCDGVEPDNVDGYQNDSGFPLTAADQRDYARFLSDTAHDRQLSVGLKNSVGLVLALEPHFDWALNEECLAYDECEELRPFLDAGKAVFHVEYVDDEADAPARLAAICDDPSVAGFSTLVATWGLDGFAVPCP